MRKKEHYDIIFKANIDYISEDFNITKGIKRYCILNDLNYFDIFDYSTSTVDAMHDVLEGVVPFLLKHFFKIVIQMKLINLEDINNRIKSFNFGYLQRKSLPPTISMDKISANIWLTASQNWCLMLHFTLIFYDLPSKVPKFGQV